MSDQSDAVIQTSYESFFRPFALDSGLAFAPVPLEKNEKKAIKLEKLKLRNFLNLRLLGNSLESDEDEIRCIRDIDANEAQRTAVSISQVNLDCSKATLDMMKVTSIWKIRPCKYKRERNSSKNSDADENPGQEDASLALQQHQDTDNTTTGSKRGALDMLTQISEDNGPLALVYSSVFSVEVSETSDSDADNKRILIFFYDAYAAAMGQLFSQAFSEECYALLSLRDLPAQCIFPHRNANVALGDCEYCICIGGASKCCAISKLRTTDEVNDDEDSPRRQRFDTNVSVEVLLVQKANKRQRAGGDSGALSIPLMKYLKLNAEVFASSEALYAEEVEVPSLGSGEDAHRTDTLADRYLALIRPPSEGRPATHESSTSSRLVQYPRRQEEQQNRGSGVSPSALRRKNVGSPAGGSIATPRATNAATEHASHTTASQESNGNSGAGAGRRSESRERPQQQHQRPQRINEAGNASTETAASANPSAIIGRGHSDYSYVQLGRLQVIYEQQIQQQEKVPVNIYGVVLHFTPPSHTRTGDWITTVTLMDETCFDGPNIIPEKVVTLNIFGMDVDRLPKFSSAGDVLRAHRVDVQSWKGEIQLVARTRGKSSFVVVRRKYGLCEPTTGINADSDDEDESLDQRWHRMSTAKQQYTFSGEDHKRCRHLWYWGQRQLSTHPVYSTKEQISLSALDLDAETSRGSFAVDICGDLTAMVTAIIPTPPEKKTPSAPQGYLRLWDGTGPSLSDPPALDDDPVSLRAVAPGNDPPLASLLSIVEIVRKMKALKERYSEVDDFSIDPPLAFCGKVVNCVVWEEIHWKLLTEGIVNLSSGNGVDVEDSFSTGIRVGQFIRLRNINGGRVGSKSLPCVMVHCKSSCTPLMDTMFDIRRVLLNHQKRFDRQPPDEYNRNSAILPAGLMASKSRTVWNVARTQNITGGDLCILAECLGEPAPASFVVRVSVIGLKPTINFSVPMDVSKLCAKVRSRRSSALSVFHFAFRLKDNSAEVDAMVSNELAEFLLGVTATHICQEVASDQCKRLGVAVEKKLKDIMVADRIVEGRMNSIRVGNEKLFILESMSIGARLS